MVGRSIADDAGAGPEGALDPSAPVQSADLVVTREQVMALVNSRQDRQQDALLRSILGVCGSVWKDLRCRRYDGHGGYHTSGQVIDNGLVAWASWERTDDK